MKIKLSLFLSLFFIVFDVHFNKYEKLLVLLSDAAYVISFCAGAYHACAVLDTYSMKCWGLKKSFGVSLLDDDFLGDDKSELGDSMPFVDVGEEVNAEQVACGEYHVCVKLDKGDVRCLGVNYDGQTGVGSNAEVVGIATGYSGDNLENVDLGSVYQVIGLALAKSHSCVVVTGNKVKCYGRNDVGQLGYGDTTKRGTCASQMGDDLPYLDLGADVEIGSVHSGLKDSSVGD